MSNFFIITSAIILGLFLGIFLLSFSLKGVNIELYNGEDLDLITLAKFKVEDEIVYLLNIKTTWDCIVVFIYLMFGRFFYKSPLIWKNKRATKICFISFCVLLILVFGIYLFSLFTLHPSTLTPPPHGQNKRFYLEFFKKIGNNVCLVFCSTVLAAKSRAFFSIIKLQCLLALVKAVYIISTFNNM